MTGRLKAYESLQMIAKLNKVKPRLGVRSHVVVQAIDRP